MTAHIRVRKLVAVVAGAFLASTALAAWFYGMEPRPKIRFSGFFSTSNVGVKIGAPCINTRTSNPTDSPVLD